jgi:hypothetical protein
VIVLALFAVAGLSIALASTSGFAGMNNEPDDPPVIEPKPQTPINVCHDEDPQDLIDDGNNPNEEEYDDGQTQFILMGIGGLTLLTACDASKLARGVWIRNRGRGDG